MIIRLFAMVLLGLASSGVGAQIIQNGSFENGYTGWTASGNQSVAANDASHPASDGAQAVVFSPGNAVANAVLSQTFSTVVGQRYGLAFDLGAVGPIADQRVEVTVAGSGTLVDQVAIAADIGTGALYVPQHWSFTANSTSTTLTFRDVSFTYFVVDCLLDNVRVVTESAQAPLITAHPQRQGIAQGASASFSVSATGSGTLSYQWRFNGNPISGATGSTYSAANVQPANAGNYDVIVSNGAGSVTSSSATLTVLPPGILLNGSFEYGSAAWAFNGDVATSTNPNYGITDGVELTHFNFGDTPANGVLSQILSTVAGQVYVLAFDLGAFSLVNQNEQRAQVTVQGNSTLLSQTVSVFANGSGGHYVPQSFTFMADSSLATLTFIDVSPTTASVDLLLDNVRVSVQNAPTITSQPTSQTVAPGASVTFSVTATGMAPLGYQWRFNGANIGGANASSYTIANVQSGNAGNYDVVVSNSAGSATSSTAVLTVATPGSLVNGSFESNYSGWNATGNQFIATSDNTYPASDGVKDVVFNAGQSVPNGVLSQTFTTTSGQAYNLTFDLGAFSMVNQNAQKMQVTITGNSTVLSQAVTVFAPGNGTRYTPQNFTFVADSSSSTLTFADVSPTTQNVDLLLDHVQITLQNAPVITSQPASQSVLAGSSVTFSVTASGQAPLSYQWRFNGANIGGANGSSYTINNVQSGNAGNYDVVVSNSSGTATSAVAVLAVGAAGSLVNGSFESNYSGWSASGNQFIASNDSNFPASDGVKDVVFNAGQTTPNGVIAQTFSTTTGQNYVLAFDLGAFSLVNQNAQRIQVTVTGNSTLLSQIVTVFAPGNGTRYTPQSFSFVADGAAATVAFTDVSQTTQNVDMLLDNVRVTAQTPPPQNLVNGSFESNYSGWTESGNQWIATNDPNAPATDGNKSVVFNAGQLAPNGILSQSFGTTSGQTYVLAFDLGAFSFVNQNAQRMQVTVRGNNTLLSQILSVSAPGNGTRYASQSFTFLADSSTATLTFTDVSATTQDVDLLLDNVRVSVQGGAAPASLAHTSPDGHLFVRSPDTQLGPAQPFDGVVFRWDGLEAGSYELQESADLISWQSTGTILQSMAGVAEFTDPSPTAPQVFYRLIHRGESGMQAR